MGEPVEQKILSYVCDPQEVDPTLDQAVSQMGANYGKLYFESYTDAKLKPDKWKWKHYSSLETMGFFVAIGVAGGSFCCSVMMFLPSNAHRLGPSRLWKGGLSLALSIAAFTVLFRPPWERYGDPYNDDTTRRETRGQRVIIHSLPDEFIKQRMIYFNFPEFQRNPHYLRRLAYYDRLDPKAYAATRVLTAVTHDWITALRKQDSQQADEVEAMFEVTGLKDYRAKVQQLNAKVQPIYLHITDAYRNVLERNTPSYELGEPSVQRHLYAPAWTYDMPVYLGVDF